MAERHAGLVSTHLVPACSMPEGRAQFEPDALANFKQSKRNEIFMCKQTVRRRPDASLLEMSRGCAAWGCSSCCRSRSRCRCVCVPQEFREPRRAASRCLAGSALLSAWFLWKSWPWLSNDDCNEMSLVSHIWSEPRFLKGCCSSTCNGNYKSLYLYLSPCLCWRGSLAGMWNVAAVAA